MFKCEITRIELAGNTRVFKQNFFVKVIFYQMLMLFKFSKIPYIPL